MIPVDIHLVPPRASTSACEASDFAGLDFSGPSDIALIQRGTCDYSVKALNAQAAGAEAVIIFNQGEHAGPPRSHDRDAPQDPEQGPLRVVGRGGGRAHLLVGVCGRPDRHGAGRHRAVPQLRHDRQPEPLFFVYDGDDSDAVGAPAGPAGSAEIEKTFERFYESVGEPFKGTDFSGRSDYGPFIAVGIPSGGLFTGAEGIKTAAEAATWGGTSGDQYDPCYHLACDTFANNNEHALAVNSDGVAHATLQYAMNTADVNAVRGKGQLQAAAVGARTRPGSQVAARRGPATRRGLGLSGGSASRHRLSRRVNRRTRGPRSGRLSQP